MMRIFIVSSVALYREGLAALLARRDGIDVVGVAADTSEAAQVLLNAKRAPHVVILDMSLVDSLSAARWLIDEVPQVHVFAITVPNRERELLAAGQGTEVRVHLQYSPPLGKLGAGLATLAGHRPSRLVTQALAEVKRYLELGRPVVLAS